MKNLKLIFIVLAILVVPLTSAINLWYFASGGYAHVNQIISLNQVDGNNLCSNNLIQIGLINSSLISASNFFSLQFSTSEQGKTFPINHLNITTCDGDARDLTNYDYTDFNLTCNKSFDYQLNTGINTNPLEIRFNLTEIDHFAFVKISYCIDNFVIHNPDNNDFIWLRTEVEGIPIIRYVVLPYKNPIIEQLTGFDVAAISLDNNQWVLKTLENSKDSIVRYRDAQKEEQDRNKRDISIIMIGVVISMIFEGLYSGGKSKRTKNLVIMASLSILVTSGILFYDKGGFWWNLILVLSWILFFFFIAYAHISYSVETQYKSMRRDLREIGKLIKNNKLKAFFIVFLPVLLLFVYLYWTNILFFLVVLFGLLYVIFIMKNNPAR